MNAYAIDTYRSHDLNIAMRTSSGDVIKMDFANENSSSISHIQNDTGSQTSANFSSRQEFSFSIKSNGISAQDQKEIDAYMKIAQPYIDEFLNEFNRDAPGTPVTKLAHQIASIFEPSKDRTQDDKENIKTNIVKVFESALDKLEPTLPDNNEILKKILEETQKLLEKTLKEFDEFNKILYA